MPRGRLQPARIALGLLLSLAAAEAALWAAGIFTPVPRYPVGEGDVRERRDWVLDDQTGWRMRPSSSTTSKERIVYRANSQGFRADGDFMASDPRFKIAIAGDSYTWAFRSSYEDSFPGLVDESLDEAVVFNLAMPGFGVDQIYLSLREQAAQLQPDLLIAAISDADFKRSQTAYRAQPERRRKPTFKLVNGRLERKTAADRRGPLLRFLEFHSRLWMGWRYAERAAGYALPVGEWWALNAAILDAIQQLGRDRDVPVLFVYVPTAAWRPFPMLDRYMADSGAAYINLREHTAASPDVLYLPDDGHLTARGHRYIAELLTTWIAERLPQSAGK